MAGFGGCCRDVLRSVRLCRLCLACPLSPSDLRLISFGGKTGTYLENIPRIIFCTLRKSQFMKAFLTILTLM